MKKRILLSTKSSANPKDAKFDIEDPASPIGSADECFQDCIDYDHVNGVRQEFAETQKEQNIES